MISVIIPAYNSDRYISSAIKSVLEQTYQDLEIIIIDDGSTDDTRKVIESFNDQRISYIYQENSGVATARNNGLKKSGGEYVAFLDADDCWLPEKLHMQYDKICSRNDIFMVYSAFEMLYEDHDRTKVYKYNHNENSFTKKLLIDPFKSIPFPSTVLIKKSSIDKVGYFNPEFLTGEDWDLWLRLTKTGKSAYIDRILVKKLTHSESITNSLDLEETGKYHFKLLNNFFNNNPHYNNLKNQAFSMIYYDVACRYYDRNNCKPTKKLYINLLKSFIEYPPLYLTKAKFKFAFNTLIKSQFAM